MAIELGSAFGKIEIDASGVKSGAAAAAAAMEGVSRAGREMSASFDLVARDAKSFQSSFQGLGIGLVAMSAAITAGMGKAIQMQFDFHDSLVKTASLAGENEAALDGLGEQVLQMSRQFYTGQNTAKDLADGLFFVESAGFKGQNAMRVLEASARAAGSGLGSTKIVADAVTSTLNAYGMGADQATHVTDILTNAVTQGKAEAASFAPALGRVLPVAAAAGVSFEQMAASMATMTRTGLSTEEAATSLRGVLSALEKPGKQAKDMLESMGYSSDELRRSIREKGLLATLQDLMDKTGGNIDVLGVIIPNIRALTGVLSTAGSQAQAYSSILDSMNTAQGATARAFEITSKDAGYQADLFKNKVAALGITMGKDLEPAIAGFVKSANEMVDALSRLSPAQRGVAEGGLAITAAVTAAAGGFILLAPRIIAGYGAMVQFAAYGKDVVMGLQLMKAGFTGAEVATTGFAGATAAALPVVLALTLAVVAAYKAYELHQQVVKQTAEVGNAYVQMLKDQAAAGKSVEDVMVEYAATQERVNRVYEAAPWYLKPFIDKQSIITAGAKEYVKVLGDSSLAQSAYEAEMRKAATSMGLEVDEAGNLIRVTQAWLDEGGKQVDRSTEIVQANYMMSESQRRVGQALKDTTAYTADFTVEQLRANKSVVQVTQDLGKDTKAAEDLRDAQVKLADSALDIARTFATANEKYGERADLTEKLAKLDAEIAAQGTAHVATITKTTMTTNELTAAQSKLYATEEGLWNIKRKKGETDAELNARMDAQRVAVDNLKNKIGEATGVIGAHTAMVGGATKAQQDERQAILDKMAAMDEEMKKELATQAVESLTPEMFGTGAEAAAKYEAAKRGLMLATGLVTQEALAEKDAFGILTNALATGMITPDQYAAALGRVRQAAADGKVSFKELTDSLSTTGSTDQFVAELNSMPSRVSNPAQKITAQFLTELNSVPGLVSPSVRRITDQFTTELNSIPSQVSAPMKQVGDAMVAGLDAATIQMRQAGLHLASGVAEGITSQTVAVGAALKGVVDGSVAQLRMAYLMESPSLVMAGMGMDFIQGLTNGVIASRLVLEPEIVATGLLFTTVLQPTFVATAAMLNGLLKLSFEAVATVVGKTVIPQWEAMDKFIKDEMSKALASLRNDQLVPTAAAFSGVAGAAGAAEEAIRGAARAASSFHMPNFGSSGGSAAGTAGERAEGGPVNAGVWTLHDNEYVLSDAMRRGLQPVPVEAFYPEAGSRVAAPSAPISKGYGNRVTIYGGLVLNGVQNAQSLLAELQAMA